MDELAKIAKELELIRDSYRPRSADNLVHKYLFLQINAFFTIFTLALDDELSGRFVDGDLKKQYFAFMQVRYTPVRYLVELFLTTAHVLKMAAAESRYRTVLSLCLSEKAYQHRIDLAIDAEENNQGTREALAKNQKEYEKFVEAYVDKTAYSLPNEISDLKPFIGNFRPLGLEYYPHAKINYASEYENSLVAESLKSFPLDAKALLSLTYALLSLDSHPSIRTLETLDSFIGWGSAQRRGSIDAAKEFNQTILRVVGVGMSNLVRANMP